MVDLFQKKDFLSHSGKKLHWKIECDAFSEDEWKCIALMIAENETRPFYVAEGVPRGGLSLANALNKKYASYDKKDPFLVVDDVFTTGKSMEDFASILPKEDYFGWVVFARNPTPKWITPLFAMPQ
jgi:hypothetical protein